MFLFKWQSENLYSMLKNSTQYMFTAPVTPWVKSAKTLGQYSPQKLQNLPQKHKLTWHYIKGLGNMISCYACKLDPPEMIRLGTIIEVGFFFTTVTTTNTTTATMNNKILIIVQKLVQHPKSFARTNALDAWQHAWQAYWTKKIICKVSQWKYWQNHEYAQIQKYMDGRSHTEIQNSIPQKEKENFFCLFLVHTLASF